MSTGVVLTIISVWCYVVLNLIQRTAARESINPRAMAFWFNFWAILLSLGILLISGQGVDIVWPTDIRAYIFLGLGILAYGIYERMRYYVARDLEASVYAIIGNLAVLIAFLGSLVWYKEALSLNKVFGVGLIIAALVLVSAAGSVKVKLRPLLRGLIAMVLVGFGWSLDKMGVNNFGVEVYGLLLWTIPLGIIIFPKIQIKELKTELKRSGRATAVLALVNVAGYYLLLKAMAVAEATVVIPISQTSTLITVLLGIVILKEKQNIFRKLLAGGLGIAGVWTLLA